MRRRIRKCPPSDAFFVTTAFYAASTAPAPAFSLISMMSGAGRNAGWAPGSTGATIQLASIMSVQYLTVVYVVFCGPSADRVRR